MSRRMNPYEVLGVSEDASDEEIKSVYRQLARTFHPDVNGDPKAVAHFREITEAFLLLSDPKRRQRQLSRSTHRAVATKRSRGTETDVQLGLQVAGINLGGLLGVSVNVRTRPLFDDDGDPNRK